MKKDLLDVLVISNALSEKYNEWSQSSEIMDSLNSSTNTIRLKIEELYPNLDEKITYNMTLSLMLYMYFSVMKCFSNTLANIDVD